MSEDELISFQEFVFDEFDEKPAEQLKAPFKKSLTKKLFIVRDLSTQTRKNIFDPSPFTTDKIPDHTMRSLFSFIKNNEPDVVVIFSPLRRAVVTADAIKKVFPKIKYKEHEYFREVKVGFCDHFVGEEFVRETKDDFFDRLKLGIEIMSKTVKENNIVLITHESYIVQLARMHLDPGQFIRIDLDVS